MKKIVILLSAILMSANLTAQIKFYIEQIDSTNFQMRIEEGTDLEMNKQYEFEIITNISEEEGYTFGFDRTIKVFNGNKFHLGFNYHEFGFIIMKDTKMVSDKYIVNINGPKYIISIDNEIISRHNQNSLSQQSKITIEFNTANFSNVSLKDYLVLYWLGNQENYKLFELKDFKIDIDLSKEKKLLKGAKKAKFKSLVILLPQVYDKDDNPILAKKDAERMYMVRLEE